MYQYSSESISERQFLQTSGSVRTRSWPLQLAIIMAIISCGSDVTHVLLRRCCMLRFFVMLLLQKLIKKAAFATLFVLQTRLFYE